MRLPENVIEIGLLETPPGDISGFPWIAMGGFHEGGKKAAIYLNSILNWLSLK